MIPMIALMNLLASPPTPSGDWHAYLDTPQGRVSFEFAFRLEEQTLMGKGRSPQFENEWVDLAEVEWKAPSLKFKIRELAASFAGTLSDGKIEGVLTRRMASPLTLAPGLLPAPAPARPQEPKGSAPYSTQDVILEAPAGRLVGVWTSAKTQGAGPAVLLIPGAGEWDRDESHNGHRPFLVLADRLARAGISSLRLDDRGAGSEGSKLAMSMKDAASDTAFALKWMKERPEVNRFKTALVGHSLGGWIALAAASRVRPSAVILLATPAMDGIDALAIGTGLTREAARTASSGGEAPPELARALAQELGRSASEFDPFQAAKAFAGPIVSFAAGDDLYGGKNSVAAHQLLVGAQGEVRFFEKINHLLQPSSRRTALEEPVTIDERLLQDLIKQLKARID